MAKKTKFTPKIGQTKAFNKDWLKYHHYDQASEDDLYYVKVANTVLSGVTATEKLLNFRIFPNRNDAVDYAVILTCWFEDIISDIGIWKTFTTICKQRYGQYVPLHDDLCDYTQGDINLADVEFLVWHLIQHFHPEEMIDPWSPVIKILSASAYGIFEQEYEYAPENEEYYCFMHPIFDTTVRSDEEIIEDAMAAALFFHLNSYYNLDNEEEVHDLLDESIKDVEVFKKTDDPKAQMGIMMYLASMANTDHIMHGTSSLLGIKTPDFLKVFWKDYINKQLLDSIHLHVHNYYMIEDMDENTFHVKTMDGSGQKLDIVRDFNISEIEDLSGKLHFNTSLVDFNGKTYSLMNTPVMPMPTSEELMIAHSRKTNPKEEKNRYSKLYDTFLTATQGKHLAFAKNGKAANDFVRSFAPEMMTELKGTEKFKEPCVIFCTEEEGLNIINGCRSLCTPDNPFYEETEETAVDALSFLRPDNDIPASILKDWVTKGLLCDARFPCYQGTDDDLKKHNLFLVDYHVHW